MGVTVPELLATHSAYELREWMAYERKAGPLSNRWRDDMLAEVHYLIQWNVHLLGAQIPTKDKKNPAPPPSFPHRPWAPEDEETVMEGEFRDYEPVPDDDDDDYDEDE